jgi:hypothetical protein
MIEHTTLKFLKTADALLQLFFMWGGSEEKKVYRYMIYLMCMNSQLHKKIVAMQKGIKTLMKSWRALVW